MGKQPQFLKTFIAHGWKLSKKYMNAGILPYDDQQPKE
jgi:hypothetical protein